MKFRRANEKDIDTVDLGYSCYGLGRFDLYERLL